MKLFWENFVKNRIVLGFVSIGFLLAIAGNALNYYIHLKQIEQQLVAETKIYAQLIGEFARESIEHPILAKKEEVLTKIEHIPIDIDGVILSEEGDVFLEFRTDDSPNLQSAWNDENYIIQENFIQVKQEIVSGGKVYGSVILRNWAKCSDCARQHTLITLLITGLMLFAIVAMAYFFQCRIFNPLVQLTNTLKSIENSSDIELSNTYIGKGVIGNLYNSYQNMINRLRKRNIEFKEMLNQLKASEERFRELSENSQQWIWEVNTEGLFVYSNEYVSNLLGYSAAEIVNNKSMFEFFPEEDRESMTTKLFKLFQEKGRYLNYENRNIDRDGNIVWLSSSGLPVLDEKGELRGYRGLDVDITQQKLTEDEVQEKQYYLKKAQEIGKIGTWELDMVNDKMFWTEENYKIFEVPANIEITPALYLSLIHPDDLSFVKEKRDVGLNKEPFDLSYRLQLNGKIKWIREIAELEFDEKGYLARVVGVTQDITQTKNIENELLASEEKYRSLLENLPGGVFRSTYEGKVVAANKKMVEMYGYSSLSELLAVPATQYYADTNPREKMIAELKKNGVLIGYETQEHKKDGKPIWISANYITTIEKNENGECKYIDGVLIDITDKKNSELELTKAKEKAEEADRLKSAFLANMSHEIRTPMNGILGFTDLLDQPDLSIEDKQNYLDIIKKSGDRMLNTVNDIIEISKIETGQISINLSAINICEQVAFYQSFFQVEAEKKGMKFISHCNLDPEDGLVVCDQNKLNSIITNLVKNAIKYSNNGEVELKCEPRDEFLHFYVKDEGIGIPKERFEGIFNRFEQADIEDVQVREGSGLGLAITKSFLQMLGGEIWLESEVGKGSTFYFTIPLRRQENIIIPNKESRQPNKTKAERKATMLVAEDDDVSYLLLQNYFESLPIDLIRAKDGVEAIELFEKHAEVDLVLLDIKMPKLDGIEVFKRIRQRNPQIPVIAQTAHALEGDKENALMLGFNNYISKPIDKDNLLSVIKSFL